MRDFIGVDAPDSHRFMYIDLELAVVRLYCGGAWKWLSFVGPVII